jgi:hypothetical protein
MASLAAACVSEYGLVPEAPSVDADSDILRSCNSGTGFSSADIGPVRIRVPGSYLP